MQKVSCKYTLYYNNKKIHIEYNGALGLLAIKIHESIELLPNIFLIRYKSLV